MKGGAFAGAIGGGTLMLLTGLTSLSADVGFGFVILSLLIGLTTGMMTGAIIGYFIGWLNGMSSGWGDNDLNLTRVNIIWHMTLMLIWAVTGYYLFQQIPLVGLFGGLVVGVIAARIAIKDFIKMIEVQSAEIDPDDLRPDRNRWKHPETQDQSGF